MISSVNYVLLAYATLLVKECAEIGSDAPIATNKKTGSVTLLQYFCEVVAALFASYHVHTEKCKYCGWGS